MESTQQASPHELFIIHIFVNLFKWNRFADIQQLSIENSRSIGCNFLSRGDKIKDQTKYILCTRSKHQHRKAIEVCHKCRHRENCDEYQQSQQPELIQALNVLSHFFDKKNIPREDLIYFKKELKELAALFRQ